MQRSNGTEHNPDAGGRRKPTTKENWIAVVVIGISLTVTGIALVTIGLSPVLTIVLVLAGMVLLLVAFTRLRELKEHPK